MRQWVAQYYPNTKTAITEYNWGAESHINGATTQADVLGIFGREGLDMGARWTTPDTATPTYKSIKMYRNYDNVGGAFGNVSVRAAAADPDNLSSFAARRTADGALTVMLIAKRLSGTTSTTVNVANYALSGPVQVWRLSSTNAIARLADVTPSGGAITLSLPPQTITLLVAVPAVIPPGILALSDLEVTEGNAGTVPATFSVVRTGGVGTTATVSYATQDDSASAGSDYVAASGTLTFGPATTSLPITVAVNGDTVDEPNERFLLRLSGASGASVGQPDGWATIVDDDAGVAGQRHEVSHGLVSRRDFAAAPQHLYAIRQERYASYEVIVDAPFGRGGAAQGPPLARVAADGTTVVQSSTPVGTGHSRQLRFLNDASAAQQAQFIRVQAGACPTGCTAADGYRLRAYETTYTIPRFNNSATQGTVVVVHNPTTRTVALRLRFWSALGQRCSSPSRRTSRRAGSTRSPPTRSRHWSASRER